MFETLRNNNFNKKISLDFYETLNENYYEFTKNHKIPISQDFIKLFKSTKSKNIFDLVDLYFMDEDKLCKIYHTLITDLFNEYFSKKKQYGGNAKYKKETNLLSCNNKFDKCDDHQDCYNYNELKNKSKDDECIQGTLCGPTDPISMMPLDKNDNVWRNTATNDCYDRDNLNIVLLDNHRDPISRDIITNQDAYNIYIEHFTNQTLQNRLTYRFNRITQYMYDNPIRSFTVGFGGGFSFLLLHDLIRYGRIELTGQGIHNGNIIDRIQGLTVLSTMIFTGYYSTRRRNNLNGIYYRNQTNQLRRLRDIIGTDIIPL